MGLSVLRGISTALLVTVLTIFAGMVWGAVGLGGLSVSNLVDIGLVASCLIGGYRTGKESSRSILGAATGAGYVTLGTILLALFLPIQGWGFIQVLTEGTVLGLVAGTVGAKGMNGAIPGAGQGGRSPLNFMPSYVNYDNDAHVSRKSDSSTSNWIKSPEEVLHGNYGATWDLNERADVEWPWDKVEDQKLISSGTKYSESLPKDVSVSKDSRPWWEE